MEATAKLKVGSSIKYYCTRCGLDLAHTILAMVNHEPVRLKCNTCQSERNYRRAKTVEKILRGDRAIRSKIARPDIYAQKMKAASSRTKIYRADETFAVGDAIQHPSFGVGVVTKIIFPDRIAILFKDQSRILIARSNSAS